MKRLLQIVWIVLCPIILNAQVELHPIYTSPHMGAGAKFNQDGSKVVTWGGFGFSVWDVKTGKVLYTVTGHDERVNYAEFNHKGTTIVTASYDGTAKIWDTKNGELMHILSGHKDWVCDARFNTTDDRIITKSEDGNALLWGAKRGNLIANLRKSDIFNCKVVRFNNKGDKILVINEKTKIEVYDSQSGKEIFEKNDVVLDENSGMFDVYDRVIMVNDGEKVLKINVENDMKKSEGFNKEPFSVILGEKRKYYSCVGLFHTCQENTLAYNSLVGKIAYVNKEGEILVVDGRNNKQNALINDKSKEYKNLKFNKKGTLLLGANSHGLLTIWNVMTCQKTYSFNDQYYRINNADFDPSGELLLVTYEYGLSKLLDAYTGKVVRELVDSMDILHQKDASKYKRCSVDKLDNQTVAIRDEFSKKVLLSFQSDVMPVFALFYRNSSRVIIQYDTKIEVRNSENGSLVQSYPETKSSMFLEELPSDPNKFAIVSSPNFEIWDSHTCKKKEFTSADEKKIIIDALFDSNDKGFAFAVNMKEECSLMDISTGREIKQFGKHHFPVSLNHVGDSEYIATVTDTLGTITFIDLRNRKEKMVLKGHKSYVFSTDYSTQGSRIVTAANDGTAIVWSPFIGQQIAKLPGSRSYLYKAYFSDDDQKIITHSGDGVIRIYDANQLPYSFTDIPEEEKQTDVSLSPNPAQNEIRICFSEPLKEKGEYAILSPTGTQVSKGEIPMGSNGLTYTIDNILCMGTYICVLRINGKSREEKFIVMR